MNTTPNTFDKKALSAIRTSILEEGSATKVELSKKIDISFPTISKFLTQMEKSGEVYSTGLDKSNGGRRAKRYTYNPDFMLGLGILLEKEETSYTIFNCAGNIKKQDNLPSVLKDNNIGSLTKIIEEIITTNPSKISSIAIGVPGSVDHGKIFYIPGYEQFHNVDLQSYYEEYFSIPVVVENDMNAAVLGFHSDKEMEKHQSLIYFYFGEKGPGAGFMINGDVVRGSTFFAGEVSFIPQYNKLNFGQAFGKKDGISKKTKDENMQIDSISRLVASVTAIINPYTIIFSSDEIEEGTINQIHSGSTNYIPAEHLPKLVRSDWKRDYLKGLQRLCLDLMMNK